MLSAVEILICCGVGDWTERSLIVFRGVGAGVAARRRECGDIALEIHTGVVPVVSSVSCSWRCGCDDRQQSCVPALLFLSRWIQGTPTPALLKEILGTVADCCGS